MAARSASLVRLSALMLVLSSSTPVAGQMLDPRTLLDLSLEELLKIPISSASKFQQELSEVPASVTVITRQEIQRYGHRTLADVLRSVRGFYTSSDRAYSYAGARGFSRVGDFNTRVLILINGHRFNDGYSDQGALGSDLPVDMALVDRIEVVRGPGSALYGTNAMFAVINVITLRGQQHSGVSATVEAGGLGRRTGAASYGHQFGNGADLLIAADVTRVSGAEELSYSSLDPADTGRRVVASVDQERWNGMFGSFTLGRWSLTGAHRTRDKDDPTTTLLSPTGDIQSHIKDQRSFADLQYSGPFGKGWHGTARAAYDQYLFDWWWFANFGSPVGWTETAHDTALFDGVTGEVTLTRAIGRRQTLTVGSELRHHARLELVERTPIDTATRGWDATTIATYVQDQIALTPSLLFTVGARSDDSGDASIEVTPRASLVYLPTRATTFKVMHGRAFRAPNVTERNFDISGIPAPLEPERLTSTEATLEQSIGAHVRGTVSTFHWNLANVISLVTDGETLAYQNHEGARARGVETEVEVRGRGGLVARASHTWVHATDTMSGAQLANSPRHLGKINGIVPVARAIYLAAEGQFVGERLTLLNAALPRMFLLNTNVTLDTSRHMRLSAGIQNLLNRQYWDPTLPFVTPTIPQNGRTAFVSASVRF